MFPHDDDDDGEFITPTLKGLNAVVTNIAPAVLPRIPCPMPISVLSGIDHDLFCGGIKSRSPYGVRSKPSKRRFSRCLASLYRR